MAGNTIGTLYKVTTWGESHGVALGVVIDGCPAGIEIRAEEIQLEVDARKPQTENGGTTRREKDKIEILAGVFEGKTTGTPISIMVRNNDARSGDYEALKDVYRPGHADYSYELKYGAKDHRGGGRASGRETVSRVIAGAIAKKILRKYTSASNGVVEENSETIILAHTIQIGPIKALTYDQKEIAANPLRCADPIAAQKMLALIETVRAEKDGIGGIIEIRIQHPPIGLGEPIFDKLHADLGKALFSIPAVKGVAFGKGFDVATMRSSENNDSYEMVNGKITTQTNHSGGILGGISTGEEIIIQIAIKPPSSIGRKQKTVRKDGESTTIMIEGRHDTCIVPRVIPIAESMVAITLVDHLFRQRASEHF